jgi:TRAP-type C4-dicarboxylate transport system substrate-binding protein
MLVMAKPFWNRLSPEEQKVFVDASKQAGDLVRKLDAQAQTDQIQQMESNGVTVTHPDIPAFREAVKPAVQKVIDYVGADFANQFMSEVDAAR